LIGDEKIMPSPQRPHTHAAPDIAGSAGSPPGRGVPNGRAKPARPTASSARRRGLIIPCSVVPNCLFRKVQGIGRKPFKMRRDRTSAAFKTSTAGQNFQNSLLNSLLAGNSRIEFKSISRTKVPGFTCVPGARQAVAHLVQASAEARVVDAAVR
jgi:hypothetical protein